MDWVGLKKNLVETGLLDKFFLDPLTISIRDSKLHVDSSIRYEPLLLETNLQQLAGHLDRALAFRKEVNDLEILAVKAACEYDLFRRQSPLNLELDLLRLHQPGKVLAADLHDRATTQFGPEPALNLGLASVSSGESAQLRSEAEENTREAEIINAVEANARAYQEAYWLRHTQSGNAHNYAERARWIGLLYGQDWLIAQIKAEAVAVGYRQIYGDDPPALPDVQAPDALHRLTVWSREMVELLLSMAADEFEVDLIVPLVQPRAVGAPSILSKADFEAAIRNTEGGRKPFRVRFTLPETLFDMGNAVRVRRVGLAYGMKPFILESGIDKNNTAQSTFRYRAAVWTPAQEAPSRNPQSRRPPVQLGEVTVYGSTLAYSEGSECMNVNPAGEWEIEVAPVPVSKRNTSEEYIGSAPPGADLAWHDLKLFLRLKCRAALGE